MLQYKFKISFKDFSEFVLPWDMAKDGKESKKFIYNFYIGKKAIAYIDSIQAQKHHLKNKTKNLFFQCTGVTNCTNSTRFLLTLEKLGRYSNID